jgi:hypothetical protein
MDVNDEMIEKNGKIRRAAPTTSKLGEGHENEE